jgi:hypothetical protein
MLSPRCLKIKRHNKVGGGISGLGKLWNFDCRNNCNLMVEDIIGGI